MRMHIIIMMTSCIMTSYNTMTSQKQELKPLHLFETKMVIPAIKAARKSYQPIDRVPFSIMQHITSFVEQKHPEPDDIFTFITMCKEISEYCCRTYGTNTEYQYNQEGCLTQNSIHYGTGWSAGTPTFAGVNILVEDGTISYSEKPYSGTTFTIKLSEKFIPDLKEPCNEIRHLQNIMRSIINICAHKTTTFKALQSTGNKKESIEFQYNAITNDIAFQFNSNDNSDEIEKTDKVIIQPSRLYRLTEYIVNIARKISI